MQILHTVRYGSMGRVLVQSETASDALNHAQAQFEALGLDLRLGVPHTAYASTTLELRTVQRLETLIAYHRS